jgi:XTP/dITP diphosphohydrolase
MNGVLLVATNNQGKMREFKGVLKDLDLKLVSLADIGFKSKEPEETGKTFIDNAVLKAKFYGKKTNLPTLADDSGLLVDALPDKLGLKTKRYAAGSDKDRYLKLLAELKNISKPQRTARFKAAIAFFHPQKNILKTVVGVCQGRIAFESKGKHGFGYDPVFIVKDLDKHFAQLTLSEKNQVSHRAKALKKMKKLIEL